MELPDRQGKTVFRVTTRSSTKNREERHRNREAERKGKFRFEPRYPDLELSDSDHSIQEPVQPVVESEKGVDQSPIPIDISREIRNDLG